MDFVPREVRADSETAGEGNTGSPGKHVAIFCQNKGEMNAAHELSHALMVSEFHHLHDKTHSK